MISTVVVAQVGDDTHKLKTYCRKSDGYDADELMYCSEVLFNNIQELCKCLSLRKYLAV